VTRLIRPLNRFRADDATTARFRLSVCPEKTDGLLDPERRHPGTNADTATFTDR
jgi:hypothetical protein